MDPMPSREEALRGPVTAYFEDRGYTVRDEVWMNGRIADLYAFDEDDTIAIELKLTDWRKAVAQAVAYQVGALYTYVALPLATVHRAMRQASLPRRYGVGVLGVVPPADGGFHRGDEHDGRGIDRKGDARPDVRVVMEARPSDRFLPFLADKIVHQADRPKRTPTAIPLDP